SSSALRLLRWFVVDRLHGRRRGVDVGRQGRPGDGGAQVSQGNGREVQAVSLTNGQPSVVIAGGGTAGHVFPGLALAGALAAPGHVVAFIGTDRGLESRLVPE